MQGRAPLAGLARPGRYGAVAPKPGLVVVERTDLSLASVMARRGREPDLKRAVAALYGVELPDGPRVARRAAISFAGIGACVAGLASVTDQSDGRLVLRLHGDRVRDVLAKGVPIDLHPRHFKTGDFASTLIAHIGVQIEQLDDQPQFQLMAPRSLGGSLWSWLTRSAAEFGYEVARDVG